jgi:hypothetical protein
MNTNLSKNEKFILDSHTKVYCPLCEDSGKFKEFGSFRGLMSHVGKIHKNQEGYRTLRRDIRHVVHGFTSALDNGTIRKYSLPSWRSRNQ